MAPEQTRRTRKTVVSTSIVFAGMREGEVESSALASELWRVRRTDALAGLRMAADIEDRSESGGVGPCHPVERQGAKMIESFRCLLRRGRGRNFLGQLLLRRRWSCSPWSRLHLN